ncbi:DNA mismatch repair protein MSH4 [Cryptococcus wingfieldii CBS 7118]|uniref:DNA mismatch repair protein MSH4 n=1 Tax=Cryptococcus wingfieldii CBS 7118 TaxID=1295528 RepID=A0A1E3K091_9TREE|nr:DNA mismatch repair protein MSH4 [Cryptococcus wingfieldii CBS 7118]ODO06476.1 DNA mismatch repair protein MSH4 [Cryptococcus wingfieldii CBS 7118]
MARSTVPAIPQHRTASTATTSRQNALPPSPTNTAYSRRGGRSNSVVTSVRRHGISRPPTRASTHADDSPPFVVALLQGKGSGNEIGVAAICLLTGKTVVTQIADNATFHKTIQHLYSHPPSAIIVPDTMLQDDNKQQYLKHERRTIGDGLLVEQLEEEFEIECMGVERALWNRETGRDFVESLAVDDELKASTLMAVEDKFYALCAVSALFKYLKLEKGIEIQERSLRIRYAASEGTMFIDVDTARSLELVRNGLTNKTTNTLFSVLNHCHTPMGSRLLRTSILQPGNFVKLIDDRLDATQELVKCGDKLTIIRSKFASVAQLDLDSILSQISQQQLHIMEVNVTDTRISLLLNLMEYLQVVQALREELANTESHILRSIAKDFSGQQLDQVFGIIDACLSREVSVGKSAKGQNSRISRLFAVRASFAPLLDVARQTYQENLQDIYDSTHSFTCQVENKGRNFYFTVPADDIEHALPSEFYGELQLKRCAKLSQSEQEVLLISGQIVANLISEVMGTLSGLYHCTEAAMKLLTLSQVRPEFKDTLAIHSGRHPILDGTLGTGECVPNHVYASRGSANFQIIQGPNMSGKSTYLRQIGILTVQAMVGCFVPAEYACFPLPDALLSRLSNDDSMEKCLSTFAAEMATSAMILVGLATPRTLVLIDELGRGTSSLEGMGISHAIAEALITRKTLVFFATHYHDLAVILGNLPGVVKSHDASKETSEFTSTFSYKVAEGAAPLSHYGLETAKLASLPQSVIERATEVAEKLSALEEQGRGPSRSILGDILTED